MVLLLYKWFFLLTLPLMAVAENGAEKRVHPFYVSVTEIHHNPGTQALEVSCRIFVDDMEAVLKQNYKTPVNLTNTAQQAQNDRLINDYIAKHLSVVADGKQRKLSYVGFEKDAESVFCYSEVPQVSTVKTLKLTTSLLQDLTPEQINILHVTVGGKRKSHKLDYPKTEAVFSF